MAVIRKQRAEAPVTMDSPCLPQKASGMRDACRHSIVMASSALGGDQDDAAESILKCLADE